MKEILNISVGSKVAQVKQVKDVKGTETTETSEGQDFLSLMFSKLKGNSKVTEPDTTEIPQNLLQKTVSEESVLNDTDAPEKSLDQHLLTEVLEVISLLQNDTPTTSFPKYSAKIESMLSSEEALEELGEVKNISDLLKLSKKYDLGLEKLTIQKVDYEAIKEEFPNLDKKSFFQVPEDSQEEVKNTFADTTKKSEVKSSEIPFNAVTKPVQKEQKEESIFQKILTKDTSSEETKKTSNETLKTEVKENTKDLKTEIKVTQNETKSSETKTTEVKTTETKTTEIKPIEIKTAEIKTTEVKATVENVKENVKEVAKEGLVQQPKKEEKTTQAKTTTTQATNTEVELEESPKSTRVSEVKVEAESTKKGLNENILQNLKSEKTESKTVATATTTTIQSEKQNSETNNTQNEQTEIKTETVTNKQEVKINNKQEVAQKQAFSTRETFSNFANDLKEKMEQYKPPIMKVQMALNPKSLGEVDVTIVNRGSNLHVNITSNSNTMTLFVQNQAEFKNSLVNMGFTNLEMNFSDQRESNKEQGRDNSSSSNSEYSEEIEESTEESVELIVPQYV